MTVTNRKRTDLPQFRPNALDPQVSDLIDLVNSTVTAPEDPSPKDRRDIAEMIAPLFRGPIDEASFAPVVVTERTVASSDKFTVNLRTYRPLEPTVRATLLYIHGGGWVAGSVDSYEPEIRRLVTQTGMTVVAIDYRLSPENRRPAALEDCIAAARAIVEVEGASLAIAGDSAGGNLALETAIALTREGVALAGLLLFYPVVNPGADTTSYAENGRDFLLTSKDMSYYWDSYLGSEDHSAFVSEAPFAQEKLRGLPPTVLVTAGFDPLRDEGRTLAADLLNADVAIVYQPNPTLTHGFQQMVPRVRAAELAVNKAYSAFVEAVEQALQGR